MPGFPGLKVCVSEVKGRHLAVTRPYKSGELLLKQTPYASILSEGQDRCDHCMKPSRAGQLQRCSKCKQTRYCCREHQRQAWQTGHAKECKALCAVHPRVTPPTVRLAARALWRAQGEAAQGGAAGLSMHSGTGTSAASEGGSWRDVQGLVHHWDVLEDSQKMLYAQMAALARQLALSGMENAAQVEQDGTLPGVEETAGLLARLAANAHTICDEELRPVGSGLYPLASMANHSCQPSAMQSFDGGTMQFRSLCPLAPGDEVTIAYIELAATRQDRREALWEQYGFDINAPLDGTNSAQKTDRPAASESTQPGVAHNVEQCITGEGSIQETGTSDGLYQAGGVAPGGVCCNSGRPAREGHEQLRGKQAPPAKQACKRITLRPPPLAELKLDLGPPGEGAHQSSQLQARVYSLHSHPPWPCDPNDGALTQLLLVQQQGPPLSKAGGNTAASSSSSSNSSGNNSGGSVVVGGSKALPGGVQAHSLQVQPEEDPADSFGGFGGAGDEEAEGAPSTDAWKQQLQRQQRQQGHHRRKRHVVQVDMWGPWAEAFLASVLSSLQKSPSATGGLPSLSAVSQTPAQTPAMPWQGEITQGEPLEQQLHALSVAVQQQQREAGSSAPNNALACPPYPCTCPMPQQQLQQQQQQQQLDVLSLAAEVGALEALVIHAETLMTHAEGGGHAQAVMLLLQGLARADGIAVRSVAPPASPSVGGGAPPPPPALSTTATVSKSQKVMVVLGPLHGLRIRLAATLMRAAVEGSSWKIALQAARTLTPLYEQLYPPVWPNLGLHFAQHAKLAMFLEHPAEAAQLADRAHRVLTVTHFGQDICVEVARIRWEAQQESGEK